jgi:hypothetical protein
MRSGRHLSLACPTLTENWLILGTRSRSIRGRTSAGHVRCSASDGRCTPARPASHVWNASVDVRRRTRRNAHTIRGVAPDVNHRTSCRGSSGSASLPSHRHRLIKSSNLVYRLAYNGDVAAGQLAVFQGASEAPISGFIRVERATQKNGQPAAARRVALKMGRRPRCSSVTYRLRYASSSRLADGPF